VALPLVAGYVSRRWIMRVKGEQWFNEKFLHCLTPVTIIAPDNCIVNAQPPAAVAGGKARALRS
jgi:ACR3 family arsenite efflux pump ArsB